MPKYLAVLAAAPGGDIVFRLLTSQPHGRPQDPRCHHGDPYPSFYLGVLGGPLGKDSWLDLRGSEDYDGRQFGDDQAAGILTWVAQEKAIRDQLARANR